MKLTAVELRVVESILKHGADTPAVLEELAMNSDRIKQIRDKALRKLHKLEVDENGNTDIN